MFSRASLFAAGVCVVDAAISDDMPLTRTPMIMTHDAATGYISDGLLHPINNWAKTQSVPFAGQLDCGARAFDARPLLDSKKGLIWHHGSVDVDHAFTDSIAEIVEWCAKNPTELVLMPISDCSGDGCMTAVNEALEAAGVKNIDSCDALNGLTYGDAKELGALPNGGAMLAITGGGSGGGAGCSIGNYDASLACTDDQGFEALNNEQREKLGSPHTTFDCWAGSGSEDVPVNRMLTYLDGISSGGLSDSLFTQHQALWQESTRSVVVGTLRGSSLLKDEEKSGLNSILTEAVKSGRWENISFLEVNNVCDGGLELLDALRNTQSQPVTV